MRQNGEAVQGTETEGKLQSSSFVLARKLQSPTYKLGNWSNSLREGCHAPMYAFNSSLMCGDPRRLRSIQIQNLQLPKQLSNLAAMYGSIIIRIFCRRSKNMGKRSTTNKRRAYIYTFKDAHNKHLTSHQKANFPLLCQPDVTQNLHKNINTV